MWQVWHTAKPLKSDLLNGLFSFVMNGIDVLVCTGMEMVIDGGKVMVNGVDIHDDCHVILIAI